MDITLLTVNVAQFPPPLGISNRLERAQNLAHCINYIDADIVVMQEMWSNYIREVFYDIVKVKYPYKCDDKSWGKFILGMHSGLFLISKYPINRSDIHHFENYRGPEHFAKKGVLGAEIKVGDSSICVFTTHLQGGSGGALFKWWDSNKPPTNIISGMEVAEIKLFVDDFSKGLPSLLAGDFNINANDNPPTEYQNCLNALICARDTYEGESHLGSTWCDDSTQSRQRIDYIFALDNKISGGSMIIPTISSSITDHLAVLGQYLSLIHI